MVFDHALSDVDRTSIGVTVISKTDKNMLTLGSHTIPFSGKIEMLISGVYGNVLVGWSSPQIYQYTTSMILYISRTLVCQARTVNMLLLAI